jgi:hypothetical protein
MDSEPSSLPAKKRAKKRLLIALVGGALLLTAGVAGFLVLKPRSPWPDPQLTAAKQAVSYPLYYPSPLPKGFSFQKNSTKTSETVTIYTLLYDGNKRMLVSTIPKPAGVQFNDFYNRILTSKQDVVNVAGKGVIGTTNGQLLGSLVTDKSWVTIAAPSGIDTQRMQDVVAALRQL